MLQTRQVWNYRGCCFAGRWETVGTTGVDWAECCSGAAPHPLVWQPLRSSVLSLGLMSTLQLMPQSSLPVFLRCDLCGSSLWGYRTICSANTDPTFSFILFLLACFLFSFPEQGHWSADARGVSEGHQWALHSELHARLLLFVPYVYPGSWVLSWTWHLSSSSSDAAPSRCFFSSAEKKTSFLPPPEVVEHYLLDTFFDTASCIVGPGYWVFLCHLSAFRHTQRFVIACATLL